MCLFYQSGCSRCTEQARPQRPTRSLSTAYSAFYSRILCLPRTFGLIGAVCTCWHLIAFTYAGPTPPRRSTEVTVWIGV